MQEDSNVRTNAHKTEIGGVTYSVTSIISGATLLRDILLRIALEEAVKQPT